MAIHARREAARNWEALMSDSKYPANIRTSMDLVPTVVEQTHRGERGWDLYSRLLKDRVVFSAARSTTRSRTS
jgi:hypothetical protein